MDLQKKFEEATVNSKQLPNQSNENLLKLYSLFKQATIGDVNVEKPTNMFDFAGIAKFNSWEGLKGVSKESAMQQYVDLVEQLKKQLIFRILYFEFSTLISIKLS